MRDARGNAFEATAEIGVARNVYKHNTGKTAAWTSAGHVEEAPQKKESPNAMKSRSSGILRHISVAVTFGVFASSLFGQKNLDVCRVTTHTRSISQGYGTGIYEIGKFPVDDFDEGAEKDFSYETDGRKYRVEAEVEYGDPKDVEKGKPKRILLYLVAKLEGEKDKPETVLPVEAEGTYRYKFGTIAVSMDVISGDIAQNFQLTCSDGISKSGVQRGEPKWLKRIKARVDN